MLNIETKELKISDKLKRKIEMIGRFTNTTPIINNGYVKNITGNNVAYVMPHIIVIKNNKYLVFDECDDVYINTFKIKITFKDEYFLLFYLLFPYFYYTLSKADKPNKKWYTDITEFNLRGEKCYLSPILDGFNGEIISYHTSKSPNLEQINDMLDKAFNKNNNLEGLIFHSDQGWQYQHQSY